MLLVVAVADFGAEGTGVALIEGFLDRRAPGVMLGELKQHSGIGDRLQDHPVSSDGEKNRQETGGDTGKMKQPPGAARSAGREARRQSGKMVRNGHPVASVVPGVKAQSYAR